MIDLTQPPPKRWIQDTLGDRVNMVRLGHVMNGMQAKDPDIKLALSILADAPSYRHGGESSNGRTHAIWALLVLGREDEIPTQLVPLSHFCQEWVKRREPPPLPTELLLMYAFISLRLEQIDNAKMAMLLVHRRRLTASQQEDLTILTLGLNDKTECEAPLAN
ncbi:MAG: hypothetical protein HQ488_00900 [Parcubacteria group bacterium]|nr:hypothetical protein [Parcubacteria group bacterium]